MKILPIAGAFTLAAALGCASIARADEDPSSARAFMTQTASVPTAHVAHTRNRAVRSKVNIRAPMDIRSAPQIVAEARRWIGASARQMGVPRSLWCADATNVWLRKSGHRAVASRRARDMVQAGRRISRPVPGAIAIFARGRGGHVGIIERVEGNRLIIISGNHGNRVARGTYHTARAIAFVQPS